MGNTLRRVGKCTYAAVVVVVVVAAYATSLSRYIVSNVMKPISSIAHIWRTASQDASDMQDRLWPEKETQSRMQLPMMDMVTIPFECPKCHLKLLASAWKFPNELMGIKAEALEL